MAKLYISIDHLQGKMMKCKECDKESNTFYNWILIIVNEKLEGICFDCTLNILENHFKE